MVVNGRAVTAEIEPRTHLADFLRESLRLTGTHLGCEHGVCGACTVMVDDEPVRACLTFAALCEGASVRTVEGLDDDTVAVRLREAFAAEHALQCGYCTPGMLVTARDIVLRLPDADDAQIRLELSGNLCRCTGYLGIVRAIRRVLDERLAVAAPVRPAVPAARFGRADLVAERPAAAGGHGGLRQRLRFDVTADALWAALRDPAGIAACIPGASVASVDGGRVEGAMVVALGPMRARFSGVATVEYDDPLREGRVSGGGDDKGGTRVSGGAAFAVEAAGDAASVLVIEISYTLRGALAQLARPAVVETLADALAGQFARNLATRLGGGTVSAGSLGWRMVVVWLRALVAGRR